MRAGATVPDTEEWAEMRAALWLNSLLPRIVKPSATGGRLEPRRRLHGIGVRHRDDGQSQALPARSALRKVERVVYLSKLL